MSLQNRNDDEREGYSLAATAIIIIVMFFGAIIAFILLRLFGAA